MCFEFSKTFKFLLIFRTSYDTILLFIYALLMLILQYWQLGCQYYTLQSNFFYVSNKYAIINIRLNENVL